MASSFLPPHFSGQSAQGLVPNEPVAQFEIGSMRNFIYLILDWATRKAAIIDPQRDLDEPLSAISAYGFELEALLLTHTHFDHIAGVPPLAQLYPKLPILLNSADAHRLKPASLKPQLRLLNDGDVVTVGNLRVRVLHTPGHSAGECCYLLEGEPPYLFSGDTLFIRDCGRTDLETGSAQEMFHSLQRIKALSPRTILLPGHHYAPECASTLEKELRESPPLRCQSIEELEAQP